jgi:hypothetical protein
MIRERTGLVTLVLYSEWSWTSSGDEKADTKIEEAEG